MPGKHIGYIRVSTYDQNTARQLDGITLDKTFEDKASGKDANRPALQTCLEYLRDGDTLHVHSIDRLARNLQDLLRIVSALTARQVGIHFHKEGLSFTGDATPFQELQLQIIAAVAQFERSLILERQREGIELAKRNGRYKGVGRKRILSAPQRAEIRKEASAGQSMAALSRKYGVSRQTLYSYLRAE